MEVKKRDGRLVKYDGSKIIGAVAKAMKEVTGKVDKEACYKVEEEVLKTLKAGNYPPTVEGIQDSVENTLMSLGNCNEVAKAYILYRARKNELREEGWEMTDLQKDIYEQKYRYKKETFDEFLYRVSDGDTEIKKAIRDKEFIPAGRILAGMGLYKDGRKVTLSNCYVLPKVEDSIEDIFDTAKYLARTYSYGGGVGMNISKLRPKGAKVNNAAKTTTGAVSFMDLYSLVTELIGQQGRRGALMLNIDVSHPDIEEFIEIKTDLDKVTGANISVNVNDEFMKAVRDDEDYDLEFTVEATGEKIVKTVNARKLMRRLSETNHNFAEPGILYQDRINSWHLMSEDDEFEFAGVNP